MLEEFTISSESRFHTLIILTEKIIGASIYSRIWYNKFIRIASRFNDATHSEKIVLV